MYFYEAYDFLQVNGRRINKPFIEKPQEADRHDNWIYYPKNAGATQRELSIHLKCAHGVRAASVRGVGCDCRRRLQNAFSQKAEQQQQLQP